MNKNPMPFWVAIFVLIAGIFMGSIFTFGMQYWNAEVKRQDCKRIETKFVTYEKIRREKSPHRVKEIAVDCENGERYFVDGVSLSDQFLESVGSIPLQTPIVLLIHPNQNVIVEFSTESSMLLEFDDTIEKLQGEASGFLILGIVMYAFALLGLYYIIFHLRSRK